MASPAGPMSLPSEGVDGLAPQAMRLRPPELLRPEEASAEREARLAFLVRLNDRLRPLDDPAKIRLEGARLLGEFTGADRVGYAEDAGDGQTVTVTRHHTAGVPDIEGRHRHDDYGPTPSDWPGCVSACVPSVARCGCAAGPGGARPWR